MLKPATIIIITIMSATVKIKQIQPLKNSVKSISNGLSIQHTPYSIIYLIVGLLNKIKVIYKKFKSANLVWLPFIETLYVPYVSNYKLGIKLLETTIVKARYCKGSGTRWRTTVFIKKIRKGFISN